MLRVENPFVQEVAKESFNYYKEFIEFIGKQPQTEYLNNPGVHLKAKIALETFCFMVPGILSLVEEIQRPVKNITYGGVMKDAPNWLVVLQDPQDITYFFNEKWGNKPAFTEMNPVEFVRTGLGVMKFIEVTSLAQTINLIKTFFSIDVALAPTSLYSELFNFTVEFRSKFKASTIKKDKSESYKFENVLINDKYWLSDVSKNIFPSFFAEELTGTTLQQIENSVNNMNNDVIEAYEYLANNQEEINDSIMRVENLIVECVKTTENVSQTEVREEEPLMREEKVENIPIKILNLNEKVDQFLIMDSQRIEKSALGMLEGELPIIIAALKKADTAEAIKQAVKEGADRKLIIDTGKTFFYNMLKGINKQVTALNVNDLNRLPQDIMLEVNLIHNTSRLNLQKLKTYLSSSIIELTKMGSTSSKTSQVEEYIKVRNSKASEMFMNYIQTPMQQIEILRAKGERLLGQNRMTKDIQITLKEMFGEFSQTSKMMATQFSQVQTHLTGVTELLEDHKLQLAGLTPQIEQNIRQQFEGFEIRFSNSMSSEIGKITSLLSAAQMSTTTSFERFTNDMINLSRGMQTVLSSLTSISKQIEELTNTTQIIKGLTETSVAKQDFILVKLEDFVNKIAQQGLEGIYTTKVAAIEDLKRSFTQNKKILEEVKLDQQKNVKGMEDILEKVRKTHVGVEDNINSVLDSVNTPKWKLLLQESELIPKRIEAIGSNLNLNGLETIEANVGKVKSVLDNGLDIEGLLKKINSEQEKLKTLRFDIPTERLEREIAAEKERISRISSIMPNTSIIENLLQAERDKTNRLVDNSKRNNKEMADEINKIVQMDKSLLDLSRSIGDRDIVTKVEQLTGGILKNIELLNPYFRNAKGETVMEKLNNLEENMRKVADSIISSGGSGGGDDKRIIDERNREITYLRKANSESLEEIDLLKNKVQAMNLNIATLSDVIKGLLDEIYFFFVAETKFQNSVVRELMNSKVLKDQRYTQAIMDQVQANHQKKLKSLFKAIEAKIPVPSFNRNEVDNAFVDIITFAETNYGPNVTPKNDVEFDWWKEYYRSNPTPGNVNNPTPFRGKTSEDIRVKPTPGYDWEKKEDKLMKI